MKTRVICLRVGDHPFLRFYDLYYWFIARKYTSQGEKNAIISVFPKYLGENNNIDLQKWIPFSKSKRSHQSEKFNFYFRNSESQDVFNSKGDDLSDDTRRLKIYLAGHCVAGSDKLESLELFGPTQHAAISVDDLAVMISNLCPASSKAPLLLDISLIACHAAKDGDDGSPSFAKRLMFALARHQKLSNNSQLKFVVKASIEEVSVPLPLVTGKFSACSSKTRFYYSNGELEIKESKADFKHEIIKIIRQCHDKTSVNAKKEDLDKLFDLIVPLPIESIDEIRVMHQTLLSYLNRKNSPLKDFRYGTGWYMSLFKKKSNTELKLSALIGACSDQIGQNPRITTS